MNTTLKIALVAGAAIGGLYLANQAGLLSNPAPKTLGEKMGAWLGTAIAPAIDYLKSKTAPPPTAAAPADTPSSTSAKLATDTQAWSSNGNNGFVDSLGMNKLAGRGYQPYTYATPEARAMVGDIPNSHYSY